MIRSVIDLVAVPIPLVAVNVYVPVAAAVGMPLIVAVDGFQVNPAGSESVAGPHEMGAVPVAVSVCE